MGSKPNYSKKGYNRSHNKGDGGEGGGGRPQSVFGMQFEDKGIEMEKATESTESPEKGALGSSSGKKIIFLTSSGVCVYLQEKRRYTTEKRKRGINKIEAKLDRLGNGNGGKLRAEVEE